MYTVAVLQSSLHSLRGTVRIALLSLVLVFIACTETWASDGNEKPELYIAAGGASNIVYNDKGDIWYWGNEYDNSSPIYPIRLDSMKDISQISKFYDANLILRKDGTVWDHYVWGRYVWKKNAHLLPDKDTPKPVQFNVSDIAKIEAGAWFNSGIKKDGSVWVWLPNRARNIFEIPAALQIPNVADAVDLAYTDQSWHHLLGIVQKDGTVWTWDGSSTYGGLISVKATQVEGLTGVTKLYSGDGCFFAMKKDGTVWGWGNNLNGQLGLNEQKVYETPQPLSFLTDIVMITGRKTYTTALKKDGTVWSWGIELERPVQFAGAVIHPEPKRVEGLQDIVKIACGDNHCLALQKDGSLWAWGKNDLGQLGDGTFKNSEKPVRVILE